MAANLVGGAINTARKYATAATSIPTGDAATQIALSTTADVRGSLIDTSTANALKATVPGVYLATFSLETTSGGTFRRAFVYVNGVFRSVPTVTASASIAPIVTGSAVLVLAAGDVVTLYGSSGGAAVTTGVADQYRTFLQLTYLGP